MWTCPKCGASLVQKNLSHSCGDYTVEGFLAGKPSRGVELFWYFLNEYKKIGPITLHPVKTRIAFMVDVRFAAVNRVGKEFLDGHLWLKERVTSPKFYKIEYLGHDNYIHRFRIREEGEIDDEFRSFMRMAYEIGQRKHLDKTPR
jgi:Domain of unknown function (DUF5655)